MQIAGSKVSDYSEQRDSITDARKSQTKINLNFESDYTIYPKMNYVESSASQGILNELPLKLIELDLYNLITTTELPDTKHLV